MTVSGFNLDRAVRAFAQTLKGASTVEAIGGALSAVARTFAMPHLLITDRAKVASSPAAALLYSARSLSEMQNFAQRRPIADHPVFRQAWLATEPQSLSDIRRALGLSESDLWDMLPPWSRGCEGLAINIQTDRRTTWNLSYSGAGGDVCAAARSALFVVSRMACERLGDVERTSARRARLSVREEEVLRLIAASKRDDEIGKVLGITARTVRFHADNIKGKLGVSTRTQAVLKILRGDLP